MLINEITNNTSGSMFFYVGSADTDPALCNNLTVDLPSPSNHFVGASVPNLYSNAVVGQFIYYCTSCQRISDASVIDNTPLNDVEISVQPNPFSEILTLNNPNQNQVEKVEWVDLTGKVVKVEGVQQSKAEIFINASYLAEGMYIMKIHTDKGILTYKLLKQ